MGPCGEDQMFELQLGFPAAAGDLQRPRTGERGAPLNELHFPQLGDTADSGRQLVDDALLETSQLVDVDLWLAERHAPPAGVLRFVDHLGHVQQRLRRDAAAVKADAPRVLFLVDQRDLHAQVSRIEGGGIAARPCAKYCQLCGVSHQPMSERRKGCSIASTTQRRKRMASAPSITRWS